MKVFQCSGTVPCIIDMLQRCVNSGAAAAAVVLSIVAEMPSRPVALVVSKVRSNLIISSSEHRRSEGHTPMGAGSTSPWVKGVAETLKFISKVELKRSTFCWGVVAITCSVCRVGIYTRTIFSQAWKDFPEVLTTCLELLKVFPSLTSETRQYLVSGKFVLIQVMRRLLRFQ